VYVSEAARLGVAKLTRTAKRRLRHPSGELRDKRARAIVAETMAVPRAQRHRDAALAELRRLPVVQHDRPLTRGECEGGHRPCPFVSCRHHLFLDASSKGSIKLNFPDLEVEAMTESCSLDVADRGGATPERVGEVMNLTRERVRQLTVKAAAAIAENLNAMNGAKD